ncbi:MAG: GerW family sporulation protein [Lachnospiraceae bacterium]|nr:GerW family sporulation protein [Lachnospiraceae bacterium]
MENEINKKEANNCSVIVDALMSGMDSVLATKTVVGEPTKVGDVIILPLVDVTFGIGAGASLGKTDDKKGGGGGGLGGKLSPSAVLVIKDGRAKLVNVKNQDPITKVLDLIPDIVDRFAPKKDSVSDDEILDAAFGKDDED